MREWDESLDCEIASGSDPATRSSVPLAVSRYFGNPMKDTHRYRRIQLILSDVDGVLTSGGIVFDNQGVELKQFHIRDGLGIRLWQRAGYNFGLITGRSSQIVKL